MMVRGEEGATHIDRQGVFGLGRYESEARPAYQGARRAGSGRRHMHWVYHLCSKSTKPMLHSPTHHAFLRLFHHAVFLLALALALRQTLVP